MKINQKLAALLLVSTGALSTQVYAQESGVEQIVSNIVSNAMHSVTLEIEQQVEKITLSASNLMSYDGSQAPVGNVTIIDLAAAESKDTKEVVNADVEKNNQSEKTDD